MLEEGSGLTAGSDFFLVFSPERVFTGRVFADLRRYPKLVGGVDDESAKRGVAFYEAVLEFDERPDLDRPNGVWDLGSAEASELAKLAETTYRDVNIGLANQFARFAADNGIDVYQVIAASNSQPFSHIHMPGIAVGGHCIPIYPRMYLWNDPAATVVRAAREANAEMPSYAVGVLEGAYGDLAGAPRRGARCGLPRRREGDGVLRGVPDGRGAARPRRDTCWSTTRCTPTTSSPATAGQPYHLGERRRRRVVQADHADYRAVSATPTCPA